MSLGEQLYEASMQGDLVGVTSIIAEIEQLPDAEKFANYNFIAPKSKNLCEKLENHALSSYPTPFAVACVNGHLPVVQALLKIKQVEINSFTNPGDNVYYSGGLSAIC